MCLGALRGQRHIPRKKLTQVPPEVKLNSLIDEYEENGDSENLGLVKADNALPISRKELRKVLLEYMRWMSAMKRDSTFCRVIRVTQCNGCFL